ncbi:MULTISPECIES: hypothetical protein [Yersinia]|uniref:hypothetical protein n=1 Tax=Yersinia TaxID=629 RepID=UPI00119DF1A7|nr:hypothetical protein [Yersinia kristensenii]MBW5812593.1 hypothetical protein [Yersinia kristensenii]MBW5817970.1 hypothetical protein [Yersinia kristensenii]MBW5829894.1 hypothetical protein [Yersinia kristensenii]MBW5842286.1 hypothetical protein [Yersinia kristensenii]MDA5490251.1 hypothetical protein [Yersinia kristensenii]
MNSQGFDTKDLEEIHSRKPTKFKLKAADVKELGRNILLGSIDIAVGSVKAAGVVASTTEDQANESNDHLRYTWEDRPFQSENRDI